MTDLPPDESARATGQGPTTWRERYDAARARGVPLDPKSEPVPGVSAYPTAYDPDHLLVTTGSELDDLLALLGAAASDFGWGVRLENLDGTALETTAATERITAALDEFDLPTIHRVRIFPQPDQNRDDQPVPPIDAWRLLQRARARAGNKLGGVGLDHG